MDQLPSWIDNLGGTAGVILGVFWMIMTGRLVPRRTHQDIINDRNAWRDAHKVSEDARAESLDQVNRFLTTTQVVEQVIRSLPHPDDPKRDA